MQNKPNKGSQTQVWAHMKKPRMLLHQRFVTFLMNIIYTAFYAGNENT